MIDFGKFLYKRAKYLSMEGANGKLSFEAADLTNVTISNAEDETPVVGSGGIPVAILKSNKNATITASNAFVVVDMMAAQAGNEKELGTFNVKQREILDVNGSKAKLTYKVVGTAGSEFPFVYDVYSDGTPNVLASYAIAATADADHFSFDPATNEITMPTGYTGTKVYVRYFGEAKDSLKISNSTETFGYTGPVYIEWLAMDPCDNNKEYIVATVVPKGTVSGAYDLQAGNDNIAHDISITATKSGCSDSDGLWDMYIVGEDGLTKFA